MSPGGGYARKTTVSAEKSRAEIEGLLRRFGAAKFAYMTSETDQMIAFEYNGVGVRFGLKIPAQDTMTISGWEAERRRLWRSLALAIKGKLVSVEDGIESFESAFLSHIDVGGRTLGQHLIPQLGAAVESGRINLPALLALPEGRP